MRGFEAVEIYTKKVMEHFFHPHNMGEMRDADGIGKVGNIVCGDIMRIFIKVGKVEKVEKVENKAEKKINKSFMKDTIVKDVKFQTLGCAAAIATSSVVTELAKGKSLEEALALTNRDIVESLGDLPQIKIHCSLLAIDALREAIYDYLTKNNMSVPEELVKTHRKVEKELETTREKYKEFVRKQEEMIEGDKGDKNV